MPVSVCGCVAAKECVAQSDRRESTMETAARFHWLQGTLAAAVLGVALMGVGSGPRAASSLPDTALATPSPVAETPRIALSHQNYLVREARPSSSPEEDHGWIDAPIRRTMVDAVSGARSKPPSLSRSTPFSLRATPTAPATPHRRTNVSLPPRSASSSTPAFPSLW